MSEKPKRKHPELTPEAKKARERQREKRRILKAAKAKVKVKYPKAREKREYITKYPVWRQEKRAKEVGWVLIVLDNKTIGIGIDSSIAWEDALHRLRRKAQYAPKKRSARMRIKHKENKIQRRPHREQYLVAA